MSEFPKSQRNEEFINKIISPKNKPPRSEGGLFLGYPHTTPLKIAIKAYSNYLEYNSNHVGTVTRLNQKLTNSRQLEKEVIEMLGDLYGDKNIDGYINSGSSEGNILATWIGKNYLCKQANSKVAVLTSELSHHSIDKAININSIEKFVKISVDDNFKIRIQKLELEILKLLSSDIKNCIIVLTSGYTCTGTSDSIEEVGKLIDKLKREYDFNVYIHIDAAIGGFVYPFISGFYKYFMNEHVKSVTVDPHKMGYAPMSTGVFLCRKNLQTYIETPINYVEGKNDDTLIGSRNGASAVATWAVINYLGIKGFRDKINYLMKLKEDLIALLEDNKNINIISKSEINMVCFSFCGLKYGRLPKYIEKKYTLDQFTLKCNNKVTYCYKIYIMPHVTQEVLKELAYDLSSI